MSHVTQRNDCLHNLNEILEGNDKVSSNDLAIGIIFLFQTTIGVLGNFFLLYHYIFISHKRSSLRSTDVILKHLFIANLLVLLSRGVTQTMAVFGLKQFFTESVCTFLLYTERVSRVVSIGTICILSVFQNIMISPINSCCKAIKGPAQKYVDFSLNFCWIANMAINLFFPLYTPHLSGAGYGRNLRRRINVGHCCIVDYRADLAFIFLALVILPEVTFSVLMICASGSMILILYRHKQQVQHLHITNVSIRSPESRATKSILLLVITFISFYTLSTAFRISITVVYNLSSWLVTTSEVISLCFPSLSPFVVMSQDSSVFRPCSAWIKNTQPR